MQTYLVTRTFLVSSAVALTAPTAAEALTLSQFVGFFHIVVGVLLTFTLGIFAVGLGLYIARLNTWPNYRDTAIKVLIRAVMMLFILILLIALVQFIQRYTAVALSILAVAVILGVVILIARIASQKTAKKKAPGPQPPPGGR